MPDFNTSLIVNTAVRELHFFKDDKVQQTFPIAVGKPSTPTPTGKYQISNKIINPGGILGTRWMGLNIPNGVYGIHGTNNPLSIGNAISNGCIRLYNEHIELLYPQVEIGTPVVITDEEKSHNFNADLPPGRNTNYTIKPGDSLWLISRRFNLPLEKIIELNKHIDPNNLFPGQKIFLP